SLDTTALTDGEHVLTATNAAGATSQRTFLVDNTAPQVTSSITDGAHLDRATVLDVEVTDANGVEGPLTIELDGAPVANGSVVGPGLAEGDHTLAITATDTLGNAATTTIAFTSAVIPQQISAPRAEAAGDDITLSAA